MIRFYWQRGSIYIFLNELLKKRYLPVQQLATVVALVAYIISFTVVIKIDR